MCQKAVNPSTLLIIKYLSRQKTRQGPVSCVMGGVRRSGWECRDNRDREEMERGVMRAA